MSSALFLITRALQQIAQDHIEDWPDVCKIILQDFYMDDFLLEAESIQEAQKLKRMLSELLLKYDFEFRKWASNEERIINIDKAPQLPLHT